MPALIREPPESAAHLLQSTLDMLAIDSNDRLRLHLMLRPLEGAPKARIKIAQGHPVYNLDLGDLVENRGLDGARLTAWRFLLFEDSDAVAAAELSVDEKSGDIRFSSINSGATFQAFETLLKDPELEKQEWDVRALRVPSLYLFALWLRRASGRADRLMPIGTVPKFLEKGRTYSRRGLEEKLLPVAKRRMEESVRLTREQP
jgi:hypothetical protein